MTTTLLLAHAALASLLIAATYARAAKTKVRVQPTAALIQARR